MRVIDHLPREIVAKMNEQQMKQPWSTVLRFKFGTETLVVGGNPIGVIFSETAQHRPDAWDYIRPILAENGGWAIFATAPLAAKLVLAAVQPCPVRSAWIQKLTVIGDTGAISSEDVEARATGRDV